MTKSKTSSKAIAFEITIGVPQRLIELSLDVIHDHLDEMGLTTLTLQNLRDHEPLNEMLFAGIAEETGMAIMNIDPWDIIDYAELKKIFKAELKAAENARKAEIKREQAEEAAAKLVNKAEEERLRKEGRTMAVPLNQAAKAEAILRAAGVNVKLLP